MGAGRTISLAEVAQQIGAEGLSGCSTQECPDIAGLASLRSAGPHHLSFVSSEHYLDPARESRAGAFICSADLAESLARPCVVHGNPYLGYARASALFKPSSQPPGIASTAVIHPEASIGRDVSIGPNVVIEAGAEIGDYCVIGANSVVGSRARLGEATRLHANVTLYEGVSVGRACIIHSGAVIGADGFGFAPDGDSWIKIHQLGSVRIADDVEIGANSCIDRGALDDTVIEEGVRIDDLVMIAHNVRIGAHSALAGQVGIAGSTEVGRHCTLAGNVGLVGHIRLADNVHVTGKTMITSSITEPGSYSSGTPYSETRLWRRNAARFNNLDRFAQRLKRLEKKN